MRAVVQRVKHAQVDVDGKTVGKIGSGLLIFVGVGKEDVKEDYEYLANKIAHLRIFSDERDLMNLSVIDAGGEALVVSQFTLWGDCRKGRRPSFVRAAEREKAKYFYEQFMQALRSHGIKVSGGEFQAMMEVRLLNDGPVTLILDSKKDF
jgi:D-tyrosyl-tRNA(Tyr) deacylase